MKTNKRAVENLKHTFDCIFTASDVQAAVEKELKRVSKQVKIAGFRPGHVPAKIVKQRYGAGIEADVLKNLVTDGVSKTILAEKIRPALQPVIEKQEHKEGSELKFTFSVEVLPDVPELSFDKITISRPSFEVNETDLEAALKRLAERSKIPSELPASTKAQNGHVVKIDFVGSVDGKNFEGGTAQDFSIEIGSKNLIEGFEEQLIGLKAGDETIVKTNFPNNYFSQELSGKPAEFAVKINSVNELVAPEINEEFASDRGFENLDVLKEALKEQMEKEFSSLVRARMKKELFDELEGICTFPVPQGMFDIEFQSIWQRIEEARKNGDKELTSKTEEELREEYTQIAKRRVSLGILLAEIGKREKITVNKEELSRAMMDYARNFPGQEQKVLEFYRSNPQALDDLRGPILEEKAVDWLFTKIKITDVPTSLEELENSENEEEEKPNQKKPAAKKAKKAEKKEE